MNYKKVIYNTVDVWYLKATVPDKVEINTNYKAILQDKIDINQYLEIYYEIGGKQWDWSERILLSTNKLRHKLNESFREIYYYFKDDILIGYFELDLSKKETEIVYFGILPDYIGKGTGRAMMNTVFEIAKNHNIKTLMLHTCSADSPQALAFYKKMGFELYKQTKEEQAHIIF